MRNHVFSSQPNYLWVLAGHGNQFLFWVDGEYRTIELTKEQSQDIRQGLHAAISPNDPALIAVCECIVYAGFTAPEPPPVPPPADWPRVAGEFYADRAGLPATPEESMTLTDYVRRFCRRNRLNADATAYVMARVRVAVHKRPDKFRSVVRGVPDGFGMAMWVAVHAMNSYRAATNG